MSDQIFLSEPTPEPERPVDYVANPLRVQRPNPTPQDPRPFVRMDLVVLATSIIARETECAELRETVRKLSVKVGMLEDRIERYEAQRDEGRLVRALSRALRDVVPADEPDDDDDDPSDTYDRRRF